MKLLRTKSLVVFLSLQSHHLGNFNEIDPLTGKKHYIAKYSDVEEYKPNIKVIKPQVKTEEK